MLLRISADRNKSEQSNYESLKSSGYSMEQVLEPIYEESGLVDCILTICRVY